MGNPVKRPKCWPTPVWLSVYLVVRVGVSHCVRILDASSLILLPREGSAQAQPIVSSLPASEATHGPVRWLDRQTHGWTNECPVGSSLDSLFIAISPSPPFTPEGQPGGGPETQIHPGHKGPGPWASIWRPAACVQILASRCQLCVLSGPQFLHLYRGP